MPARRSRSSKKVKNAPKSREACANRNMKWVKAHKSRSAKGKKVRVSGSCRKKARKSKSKSKSRKM